jgi:hypothetical protein
MADNINVSITADATKLRSQLALAQADVRQYGAQVRSTANEIRNAGDAANSALLPALDAASSKYNAATSAAAGFRESLAATGQTVEATELHFHRLNRGIMRVGQELATGEISHVPMGLAHIAMHSNLATIAIEKIGLAAVAMAGVSIVALIGLGIYLYKIVEAAHAASEALHQVGIDAVFAGRSGPAAMEHATEMGAAIAKTGITGTAAAKTMGTAIQSLGNITDEQKDKIASLADMFYLGFGEKADKAAEQVKKIFADDTSLKKYIDENHLMTADQQAAWDKTSSSVSHFNMGLDVVKANLESVAIAYRKQNDEAKRYERDLFDYNAGIAMGVNMPLPEKPTKRPELQEFTGGVKGQTPQQEDDTKLIDKHTEATKGLQLATTNLTEVQEAAERINKDAASTEETRARAQVAVTNAQDALTKATKSHTDEQVRIVEQGFEKIKLANMQSGLTGKALKDKETSDTLTYYTEQATLAGNNEALKNALLEKSYAAREAMDRSVIANQVAGWDEIKAKMEAHATNGKALTKELAAAEEMYWKGVLAESTLSVDQRTAAETKYGAAHVARLHAQEAGAGAGAKKELADKLSELSLEQNANKDDFDKVMELEDQKIALLRAGGAKETAALNAELSKQITMRREHETKLSGITAEGLAERKTLMDQDVGQRREELQVEVALGNMSKQDELATLRTFVAEQHALWLQAAENFKATLNPQSDAYRKLIREMETTQAKWVTDSKKMDVEAANDMKQEIDKVLGPIESAFDAMVTGVIQGTQTMAQMMSNAAQSIAASYLKEAAKAGLHWLLAHTIMRTSAQATEMVMTTTSATGAVTRTTIRTTEALSAKTGELVGAAAHAAGEATKTGATVAGAAARSSAEHAGFFGRILAWIAQRIASWLGMEGAETAATTGGVAARTTVEAAGAVAGNATRIASNIATVTADAAVAAAGAFAAIAAIPFVGPFLAPPAAAAAEASVLAFLPQASLATGSWSLPSDMTAQLHAGEMVIPASFADGLRSNSGGSSMSMTYAPSVRGDGNDVAGILRQQAAEFKSYIWHASRNGGLRLPGRG